MRTTTLNYVLYQVGWLAAIAGAAASLEATGAVVAAACMVAHLALARERGAEARLMLVAATIGTAVELFHWSAGTYDARSSILPAPAPPLWLLVLWAQFATTFRYCLRPVLAAPGRAALFGAAGGPLAFWAASRFGALELHPPVGRSLVAIGASWTLALVVFAMLVRRAHGAEPAPTYRHESM